MESPLEIRYAGVVIGRAQEVRSTEGDPPSLFFVTREPMPVGSVLHLRMGDREAPARVVHTVESPDAALCGMQVRLIGEGDQVATEWIPPPPAERSHPAEDPVATAMPVIEVGPPDLGPAPSAVEPPRQDTAEVEEAPPPAVPAEAAPAVSSEPPAVSAAPAAVAPEIEIPVAEPAVSTVAAAETPSKAPGASGEMAAIPEAVPVAVGSSMTGALENAAQGSTAAVEANEEDSVASSDAAVGGEGQPTSEDLPPARPIAGPGGRRKTKRRR